MFEYTYHFNRQVIDLLTEAGPDKSVLLINHTLNAQQIWNARIEQKPAGVNVWDVRDYTGLHAINEENYRNSLRIVDTYDFGKKINYVNSRGEAFENTVRDILYHAVNHSTYHRGQIATDCVQNGLKPLVTDYIFYKRDNL